MIRQKGPLCLQFMYTIFGIKMGSHEAGKKKQKKHAQQGF